MAEWNEHKRNEFDPDHDSIFLRFEQLEKMLTGVTDLGWEGVQEALSLIRLLRAQVLK